jgi:hypothetical protein
VDGRGRRGAKVEHERPDDVAWFELATAGGPAARVVFAPPPAIPVGPAAPPRLTPAESCLAWLSRQDPVPELGRSGGREVVAAVAEGLVSVGAMPAQSPLMPPILGRHKRSSHPDLPLTWPHPVHLGTPPDLQIALCAALPFEDAAAVIEGSSRSMARAIPGQSLPHRLGPHDQCTVV